MNNLEKISFSIIIVIGAIFSLNFLPIRQEIQKWQAFDLTPEQATGQSAFKLPDIVAPKKIVYIKDVPEHWDTLVNNIDGYSIDYPYHLNPYKTDHSVSFMEDDYGPASIGVTIWSVNEIPKDILDTRKYKIEKVIKIGNYDGIVTHARSRTEEYTYEKTLIVRKGDKYYLISTRQLDFDHERLWKSFRFLEPPVLKSV